MFDESILNAARKLLDLFKIDGEPAGQCLTKGQLEIAASILFKATPRIACLAPTGYGKSEAVSMAVIYRSVICGDPFVVASVKYGTSDIIMNKVIGHIFDNDIFISQLSLGQEERLDRLRQERKKTHLTFKRGGSIKIASLHGSDSNVSQTIGEHEPNIVLDESPLLSPAKYLQVLKIMEGTGNYDKTFLFELGNAINRNHFMRNVLYNESYMKLNISLDQAIAEGRLDPRSIEEARTLPNFEQFYLCKFPDEDEIDEKGYRSLFTQTTIHNAQQDVDLSGYTVDPQNLYLGADIGGGGDSNVYVMRTREVAWVEGDNRSNDTMTNVAEIVRLIEKYKLLPSQVFIDDTGIGKGVSDRLHELGHQVQAITVGSTPQESTKFKNVKAENLWNCKLWIDGGGKLQQHDKWDQLTQMKYKVTTDKVIQIEPKDDMKKRTGKSPDFADALALTFNPPDVLMFSVV